MIKVQALTKTYSEITVLKDATFTVSRGVVEWLCERVIIQAPAFLIRPFCNVR